MDSKKFIIGGLLGGVAHFFLGWVVWGMLIMGFMHNHSNPTAAIIFRNENEMKWWAMIVGNLTVGFLICYVLTKANIKNAAGGAFTGAVVGMLHSLATGLIVYAQMMIFGLPAIAADVVASAVVLGIVGGIVGWYLGRGDKGS